MNQALRKWSSMLVVLAMTVVSPLSASQTAGHVLNCGKSKVVYEDDPGSNGHTVYVAGTPGDTAMINAIEQAAAQGWSCKGCPPGQTGCAKSVSSNFGGGGVSVDWEALGDGFYSVTTSGLTVTVSCSTCSGD